MIVPTASGLWGEIPDTKDKYYQGKSAKWTGNLGRTVGSRMRELGNRGI